MNDPLIDRDPPHSCLPTAFARRRNFLRLPLEQRQKILAAQAEQVAPYYEREAGIEDIGGGDFVVVAEAACSKVTRSLLR